MSINWKSHGNRLNNSDEEIDYMSDDFLVQCTENNDVCPGLNSRATKRKFELEKRKKERDQNYKKTNRSVKAICEEKLKEGLNTALSSSNKGFAMLQKMGYTPGSSLGKTGSGRTEPIPVDLKNDRVGLGWQQMIQAKRKKNEEMALKRMNEKKTFDADEYRERKRKELQQKRIIGELRKCQRTCYQLDTNMNWSKPVHSWFWPPDMCPEDDDYCEDDKNDDEEKEVNEGEENEEEEGDEESERKKKRIDEESLNNEDDDIYYMEQEDYDIYEPEDQLEVITSYLRESYFYCIWCGTKYENQSDLDVHCPGFYKDDHDF